MRIQGSGGPEGGNGCPPVHVSPSLQWVHLRAAAGLGPSPHPPQLPGRSGGRPRSLPLAYLALGGGDAGLQLAQRAEVMQLEVGVDLEGKGHLGEVPPHTVHGEQHGPGPTRLGSARPGHWAEGRRWRGVGGGCRELRESGGRGLLAPSLLPSLTRAQ